MNPTLSKWLFYLPVTRLRGERIRPRLEELNRSQWESKAYLQALAQERLRAAIDHARCNTRYYRRTLDAACSGGPIDAAALTSLPTISKQDVVEYATDMRASVSGPVEAKTTGGSTGKAVTIYKDREALGWERAVTWRGYGWAGLPVASPQARFWGVPATRKNRLVAYATDLAANRRRYSAFGLDDERLAEYYASVLKFRPYFVYGYVSLLLRFADFLVARGLKLPSSVRAAVCTSELLEQSARVTISEAFGCRVFNEYGCGEVGSVAHECEHGRLHVNSETLHVEIDTTDDQPGEIVVTDYFNRAMPLIRYRLGDYAVWSHEECPCGRHLPVLDRIVGRAYDMLIDSQGRWHHPETVMYIFEDLKRGGAQIHGFQVIQTAVDKLLVRLVGEADQVSPWHDEIERMLCTRICRDIEVIFEQVGSIPREPSGKLRLVQSKLRQ